MTFNQIVEHFGSVSKAQRVLGYRVPYTIYKWRDTGVPRGAQYRIQVLTGGVLRAEEKRKHNGKKKR